MAVRKQTKPGKWEPEEEKVLVKTVKSMKSKELYSFNGRTKKKLNWNGVSRIVSEVRRIYRSSLACQCRITVIKNKKEALERKQRNNSNE